LTATSLQDDAATSHRDNAVAPKIVKGFVYFAAAARGWHAPEMVIGREKISTHEAQKRGPAGPPGKRDPTSRSFPAHFVAIGPIDHGRPPSRMRKAKSRGWQANSPDRRRHLRPPAVEEEYFIQYAPENTQQSWWN